MPRTARGGFTLIEMMVALMIAGLVVLCAHAVVSLAQDTAARRQAAAEPVLRGHATRQMLEGWLRSAWLSDGPLVTADRRDGSVQVDAVAFGVADGGWLYPGPARIRLWVERNPASPWAGIVAEVRLRTAARPDTIVVARGARELAIRYRVRLDERPVWVDSWASATQLPEAIELRIGEASGSADTLATRLLAVPIVAPLGGRTR